MDMAVVSEVICRPVPGGFAVLFAFAQIRPVIAFDFEVARPDGFAVGCDRVCSVVAFVVNGYENDQRGRIAVDVLLTSEEEAGARAVVDQRIWRLALNADFPGAVV